MESSKRFLRQMVLVLRSVLGVEVVDVTKLTTRVQRQQLRQVARERKATTEDMRKLVLSDPSARYDLEYSKSDKFEGTHYWFWSPILELSVLKPIIKGYPPRILEVGSGNGTLLRRLAELGLNAYEMGGVDISSEAVNRIRETGSKAIQGTITATRGKARETDVIFLSYFVDRDSDQKETFEESAEILCDGGTLVLEGLFPCILSDSSGVQYGTANVTKGVTTEEDIKLVVEKLEQLEIHLGKVLVGQRLVYSLDGPEVLPSYILIFQKYHENFPGIHPFM